MNFDGDPLTTFAILVGVEAYAGGADWHLDGPASSAMRMAEWLLARDVPAQNISLYVNFTPTPAAAGLPAREALCALIDQHGIVRREPSRSELELALELTRLAAPPQGNANLLLYFCGHGLSSEIKKTRYALTSDAREGAHHAIDLIYQSNKLRLHPKALPFARQWVIQDACAQTTNRAMAPECLGSELPEDKQAIQQYCLYATRPSEFALVNAEQGADFTVQLLDILSGVNHLTNLNLEAVCDELGRRFQDSKQHPVVYRYDENWAEKPIGMGPVKGERAAVVALSETLRACSISADMVHEAFRTIARTAPPAHAATDQLAGLLASLVSDRVDGLDAVERFGIRVESYCARHAKALAPGDEEKQDYQGACDKLKQWVDTFPKRRDAPAVKRERARLAAAADAAAESPIIVLDLVGDGQCGARAWCYSRDGLEAEPLTLAPGTLKEQVSDALAQLSRLRWLRKATVIEMVLPVDAVLHPLDDVTVTVDTGGKLAYRLGGENLLLVMRVGERWTDVAWRDNWRGRWKASAEARQGRASVAWIGEGRAGGEGWCWIGASDVASGRDTVPLQRALFEGAPFAVWCNALTPQEVEEKLSGHPYADLITLLQGASVLTGTGKSLTCLVDDPTRLPPGAVTSLRQPSRKANS